MRPDLFEQHTVHFHGYPNASSYYDGVPDATWAINIGGSATYYYLAPDAETYFYHCHITPPEHLQMGIVGQLYVRPRQNRVPIGGDLYKSLVGCVGNPIGCSGPGSTNPGQQSDLRTACNTSSVTDQDILCSTPVPQSDSGFMQVVDPFAGTDPRIPAGTRVKYAYNDGDGSSENGTISNNWFLLNQSFNQTLPTDGGAITIHGVPSPGNCEGPPIDTGCPPTLTDGSGNVSILNNIITANMVESGNGGGIRLQLINGTDVRRNPNNGLLLDLINPWWQITIMDNVIVNNVAAWAGGGITIRDAVNTIIANNTIANNDTTNTAGVEFDTVGANQGSLPPTGGGTGTCGTTQCNIVNPITTSTYSPSGIVSEANTPLLVAAFGTSVRCPFAILGNTNCTGFSNPELSGNIVWQNRSFHIDVNSNPIPGLQNVVTLVPQLNRPATGSCPTGADYWEIGVLGDNPTTQAAGSNPSGYKLNPLLGDMTTIAGYTATGLTANVTTNPSFVSPYCNGSRIPPEIVASICTANANARGCSSGGQTGGIGVPPGIPDLDPFYPLLRSTPRQLSTKEITG